LATLNLIASRRRVVSRQIESVLKADPDLKRLGIHWKTWGGQPADRARLPTTAAKVAIRLTPGGGADDFLSPDSLNAPLVLNLDVEVRSADADDPEDLWEAIQRALYPRDDPAASLPSAARLAIQQALRDAGAVTGLCGFNTPSVAFEPDKASGGILGFTGQIKIDVRLLLNG
jgi:hypothetical protein